MPGYNTHLGWSSSVGVGLGCVARFFYDVSIPQSIFGGVLCALGGVLPDLDSQSSRAHVRCMATIAGAIALLSASRLRDFDLEPEPVVMVGATVFFAIFYGVGKVIKKCTVHRGMCHSLPFALIAAEIIYILSSGGTQLRLFKAGAIFFGVMVHLTLDEIYSVETGGKGGGLIHLKNSFGTAIKLIDYKHLKSTIFVYSILLLLSYATMNAQEAIAKFEKNGSENEVRGKAAVDRVRLTYPKQFELSAVQWVAENDFVLTPGTENNEKWDELQEMLALGPPEDAADASPNDPAEAGGGGEIARDGQKSGSSVLAKAKESISLLDVVNWNSRNADKADTPDGRNDAPARK